MVQTKKDNSPPPPGQKSLTSFFGAPKKKQHSSIKPTMVPAKAKAKAATIPAKAITKCGTKVTSKATSKVKAINDTSARHKFCIPKIPFSDIESALGKHISNITTEQLLLEYKSTAKVSMNIGKNIIYILCKYCYFYPNIAYLTSVDNDNNNKNSNYTNARGR